MLKEIEKLIETFNESGIELWVVQGVFLGIVREGRLLEHDKKDIDLAVWFDDVENKEEIIRKKLNNNVEFEYFEGILIRINIISTQHEIPIGIAVYQTVGNLAVYPKFIRARPENILMYNYHRFFNYLYKIARKFKKDVNKGNFLWCEAFRLEGFIDVRSFFENLTEYELEGCRLVGPEDYDGYLSWHYGDWHKPKKNWQYRNDDLGYVENLEKLFSEHLKNSAKRKRIFK